MRPIFIIMLLTLGLYSCNKKLHGEGDIMQNERILMQPVSNIELNGHYEAVLINDTINVVIVEGQENVVKNVILEENDGDLIISEKAPVKTDEIYKIYIRTTGIEKLEINDNVNFDVAGELRSDKFKIKMSDNARLNTNVFVDQLELIASDQAKVTFKGNSSDFEANLSDNVKFISPVFITSVADIEMSDNVEANFQIIKELNGEGSDNSILEYAGNPDKDFVSNDQSRLIKTK